MSASDPQARWNYGDAHSTLQELIEWALAAQGTHPPEPQQIKGMREAIADVLRLLAGLDGTTGETCAAAPWLEPRGPDMRVEPAERWLMYLHTHEALVGYSDSDGWAQGEKRTKA